jgi:hypothetical protein
LKTRKRVLGVEHPDTLTSISNLVRLKRAEELARISNPASTFSKQGRLKSPEVVQLPEMRKRYLGLNTGYVEEHLESGSNIV